jgi:hypothetical protein
MPTTKIEIAMLAAVVVDTQAVPVLADGVQLLLRLDDAPGDRCALHV